MIQDISPYRYRVEYENAAPQADSPVLFYDGNRVFLKKDAPRLFCYREAAGKVNPDGLQYLFAVETAAGERRSFFLVSREEDVRALTQGLAGSWEPVRVFRTLQPRVEAFAIITGYQLYGWYRDTRYCGRCGGKLEHDEKERMMRCPACGNMVYPKISPAVIVGVIHKDRLLMTKYAGRDYTRYALIAGFNEVGETIEETVHREVLEEVGIRVINLKFYKSQPWSLTSTLLMGFYAELDGSDEIHLDDGELSVGEWLTRDEIEEDSNQESLTWEMIENFKHHGDIL